VRRGGKEIWGALGTLCAYLFTVLPTVRRELRRWGPLPAEKARNAEAVAVFATLAPRAARATAVRAIVALQVAIDHRDAIEEGGPVRAADAARLERLEASWRREASALPAHGAVSALLELAVGRCEEGQRQTHAAAAGDTERLRAWALGLEAPAGYRWSELAAAASSSVAAHALIAAAAARGTDQGTAARIDAAYFPPIGALTVLLDDLVDRAADRAAGEHNYLAYYNTPEEAGERSALIAARAESLVESLPHAARHRAILAGVAGYYLGGPGADAEFARPVRERLLGSLGPGARALTAFTRVRRLAERKRPGRAGDSPGP
jgi:hypothetical protein